MRKQHTKLALEQVSLPVVKRGQLSMEEEILVIDAAREAEVNINNDLAEVERTIGISDALEDMAIVADSVTEARPETLQMMEIVSQMATAGSNDVTPEEVVPALEAYIGTRIATEGYRETSKILWEQTRQHLRTIWEAFVKFFLSIFKQIPNLRARLKAMYASAEEVDGSPEQKMVELTSGVSYLCVKYVPVRNEHDLKDGLTRAMENVAFVYNTVATNVARHGETIAAALKSFNPEKAEENAMAMLQAMKRDPDSKTGLPGQNGNDKNRFNGFETKSGHDLLGNVKLVMKTWVEQSEHEKAILATLDKFRSSGVEMVSSSENKTAPTTAQFATLTKEGIKFAVGACLNILDNVEQWENSPKKQAIEATRKHIEAASEAATLKWGQSGSAEDDIKGSAMPYYRTMLNFNASYARWAQQPMIPTTSNALAVVRATMVLVQKSLHAYGKQVASAAEPQPAAA